MFRNLLVAPQSILESSMLLLEIFLVLLPEGTLPPSSK
jgi:hypothetical protein